MSIPHLAKWARTSSSASDRLPSSDRHEGAAEHPFAIVDRKEYRRVVGLTNARFNRRIDKSPEREQPIGGLVAIQHTVLAERVDEYVAEPARDDRKESPVSTTLPIVVRVGGVRYIHDGTHRLTAAHLRGEEKARVRYLDLDGEG